MIGGPKVVAHPSSDVDPLRVSAQLLVSQLRRLQRRIKDGVDPSFAELFELFETTDFVERHLRSKASPAPTFERCPMDNCEHSATVAVSNDRRLCAGHAAALEKLMGVRS